MEIELEKIKKVYFIGIGGIGISAIARLMNVLGKEVAGSDSSESPITNQLSQFGITIHVGHKAKHITDGTDLVVYTIAIPEDNPEIIETKARGIIMVSYPQMLSVISKNMYTIAISGTHGKTTTTAMIAKILINANLDPTVIVGSLMKDTGSNLTVGHGKYFVVEACEYRRSFLNLHPTILVITNVDLDHLDYYKDLLDIQSAFRELVLRIPKNGALICNVSDPRLIPILENLECNIIDYVPYIDASIQLKAPGEHNRQNAAAGFAVANFLNIDKEKIISSLEEFTGTWRRFDLHGKTENGAIVYDDYAHHPAEIKATLKGLREMYPNMKRIVFFQPHLFSRTKTLLNEFGDAFADVDEAYILPIYAAREDFDPSIDSNMVVEKIENTKAFNIKTFDDAIKKIKEFDENTVVVTMGAGDVYKIAEQSITH